jgi:hypothetical protein
VQGTLDQEEELITNVGNLWSTKYKNRSTHEASMSKSRQYKGLDSEYQELLERDLSSDDSETPGAYSDEFGS